MGYENAAGGTRGAQRMHKYKMSTAKPNFYPHLDLLPTL
jgi:hypothetical protein